MTDLVELAARCEAATGPDRALMCAAFKAVFPEVSTGAWDAIDEWDAAYDRFCAMLDVGAHESAAMTLVPEGWTWQITQWTDAADARVCQYNPGDIANGDATAATPALALTAVCLRALAQGEG